MEKVGFKVSNVNFKQNSNSENKQNVSTPIVDEEKSNAAKYAIGATALATIVVAGIATKGKLWGKTSGKAVAETQQSKPNNLVNPESLNEEGRKVYLNIKQKLDGSITCKVKDKKSNELKELGQYYHMQEQKMNNIKEQLKKENILNYQIEFKKNKITVKNGEIEKLINENGESWQITEATDKEFVKELKQAINKENDKRVVNEISTREGLSYLEAEEKSVKLKKSESDKNNEEWLRTQHQTKEKEYSDWWNNELNQKAKETLFAKNLETIGLYANGLKLDEEVVANGQKFVFKKGKLEKVLDADNKEIKIDKNVALGELESILSEKYELGVIVPKLKKQINNATAFVSEEMKNIQNILHDLKPTGTESGKTRISKEIAGRVYAFDMFDDELLKVSVDNKNGQKFKIFFKEGTICLSEGKNRYEFISEKGKYRLICLDRDLSNCNVGDVSYYRIPYYRNNNHAEVRYKMPHCTQFGDAVHEFEARDFYTDLKSYHSKRCLSY